MNEHEDTMASRDEQALRALMRGAVGGIHPAGDALERLRYAVPARRARKRQVLVAAAAATLLVGTAVPAALHMSGVRSESTDHSAIAGHGQQGSGQPDGPSDPHQNGATTGPKASPFTGTGQGAGGTTGAVPAPSGTGFPGSGQPGTGPSGGAVTLPDGSAISGTGMLPPPAAPGVPGCVAGQLGVSASARPPEADGKVYGSFKVTNVSARGCTVLGPDTVTAEAAGTGPGGTGSGVAVVGHATGDPATGLLPDPSAEAPLMLLAPNAAYEVRFAWVPSGKGCTGASEAPSGGSSGAKPPQGGSSAAAVDGGAAIAKDPEPHPAPAPAPDPVGVEVSHTPSTALPGAPTTQTVIPDACGGTVYRTGVIPLAEPTKP
ncbi:hypothetical protein [Streptomyces sp. NBC_00503]|uniref:hypothetical protein n=1 Tax=Streptomyces sp. NBC_00503 TaxID=2903659 RepID=UPI002E80895C|nr:hypothetical protein [Streptomyces sp. NBC_00503]WUD82691.1 hypothetical protein OG490_20275 [Streptomyces sp. NBC_00503]